jgi:NADH-quinone oxidoreductase subunit C
MTSEEIIEKVKASQGEDILEAVVTLGDAVIHVAPDSLPKVAKFLKEDPDMDFDYLSHITGVDYLDQDQDPRYEAVYELHSMDQNHTIRIRVGLQEDEPSVPTVCEIWKGAMYPEQELFDMYGFNVAGHPKLERLIMPEDWEGHPLRKDYPLMTEEVAFSFNDDFKSELVKSKPETR